MIPRSRIRARRPKPRRGQPTSRQTEEVRLYVYGRSGGVCEIHLAHNCIPGVLPWKGPDPFSHGHLVHFPQGKIRGGTNPQNCRWGCWHCHLEVLHNAGGKPCPPKPRSTEVSQ